MDLWGFCPGLGFALKGPVRLPHGNNCTNFRPGGEARRTNAVTFVTPGEARKWAQTCIDKFVPTEKINHNRNSCIRVHGMMRNRPGALDYGSVFGPTCMAAQICSTVARADLWTENQDTATHALRTG